MKYEFRLQDPTNPQTIYLFEALVEGFSEACAARGIFAFASRDGVDALLTDEAVTDFLGRGALDLIVGLDAVTNRPTLERLQELQTEYASLQVRVFWNRTTGLFHPKIAHFEGMGGKQSIIVGSGNLTPGGLKDNFEAYSIVRAGAGEVANLASWELFIERHRSNIRPIDDEALERAARNIFHGGRRRRRDVEPDVTREEPQEDQGEEEEQEKEEHGMLVVPSQRMLIAHIPKAGGDYGRWNQAHFNKEIMERFFQAQPNMNQRIYLMERRKDNTWADQEVRPVVYSQANKNLKIELGARKGERYPSRNPPIAIFRELQVRTFQYVILMPGEPGYAPMLRLTQMLPSVGRGLPRVLTDVANVRRLWPDCPLN
jgi:HKD family nuclease